MDSYVYAGATCNREVSAEGSYQGNVAENGTFIINGTSGVCPPGHYCVLPRGCESESRLDAAAIPFERAPAAQVRAPAAQARGPAAQARTPAAQARTRKLTATAPAVPSPTRAGIGGPVADAGRGGAWTRAAAQVPTERRHPYNVRPEPCRPLVASRTRLNAFRANRATSAITRVSSSPRSCAIRDIFALEGTRRRLTTAPGRTNACIPRGNLGNWSRQSSTRHRRNLTGPAGSATPQECPAGTYGPTQNLAQCPPCPEGFY